jgi:hypothetical protein
MSGLKMGLAKKCKNGEKKGNLLTIIREEKSFEKKNPWTLKVEIDFQGCEVVEPLKG